MQRRDLQIATAFVLLFLLIISSPILTRRFTQSQSLAFSNVRVFDGTTVLPQTTVIVQDGRIAAVGDAATIPPNAAVVDGTGKTLLPGLIDAHVHVLAEDALRQNLVFGITTVLDMGSDIGFVRPMKDEQAQGQATDRADIFSAGTLATAPGGHGTQFGLEIPTLAGPGEAEAWVESRAQEGADFIKLVLDDFSTYGVNLPTLSEETFAAVIKAAEARGLITVTHISTLQAAKTAIRAGTDGLAHIFVDQEPDQEFLDLAREHSIFVIPTLSVYQSIGEEAIDTSLMQDPNLRPYLSQTDLQSLRKPYHGIEGLSLANARVAVRELQQRGVPILAGTDSMLPGTAFGASLHRELELMVESGLPPIEALTAATSVPAKVFSLEDRGSIVPGLRADLLLVNGDPTQDITATRDIAGIWKAGVQVDREAYLQTLETQPQAAAQALAQDATTLVSDFEQSGLWAQFGQPWTVSTDKTVGGASVADLEVTQGGAQESQGSLLVRGEVKEGFAFPWAGAMFMPGTQPYAPADLSGKPVLDFWAKGGEGLYQLQVLCQNLGQKLAGKPFKVSQTWQQLHFDLSTFDGCDTAQVQAIIFSSSQPGAFAFQLDEVKFQARE